MLRSLWSGRFLTVALIVLFSIASPHQIPAQEPAEREEEPAEQANQTEEPDKEADTQADEVSDEEVVVPTEEVVISATKTPVPVKNVTSAVEVITGEEMKRRKVKMVADALRLGQGLAVFSSGGPGTTTTVRIRGGSSEQTLVLIDGVIMNSGTTGQYDFANLTTDNIEKIEILRGPQSMLWGSDAMGGVINITTKRGRGAPQASAFFEYGSFLSIREGGQASGQKGPLDFSVALSRWDFTGFSAIDYRIGAYERDRFGNWQASTQLGLALPKDGRLQVDFRWLNGSTHLDGFAFNSSTGVFEPNDVFSAQTSTDQLIFAGSYEQPFTDWWSQILTLGRTQDELVTQAGTLQQNVFTGEFSVPSLFNNSQINTLNNRIEWQHNFQLAKPLLLTGGYQFREQQGENESLSAIPTKIISSNSGFGELQMDLWERVFATGGLRYDSFNTFGDATTWRVTGGYLHQQTGTKLRGSYGTGFRAPTINQLFFPAFGNPTLQPEKSQGWDIGIEQFLLAHRLKLSAGYFWNRFRDLIVSTNDPVVCGPFTGGASDFCAQNVGTARSQGVEAGFTYTLVKDLPGLQSLDFQGQYTYTNTKDLTTGDHLPRWPEHQASAVLAYTPIESLLTTLSFRFVGERFNTTQNRQPLPSFTVFDLTASYDVNRYVQIYTRVDNLFDEQYEEVLFFGTPIRSIYGGLVVRWSGVE